MPTHYALFSESVARTLSNTGQGNYRHARYVFPSSTITAFCLPPNEKIKNPVTLSSVATMGPDDSNLLKET